MLARRICKILELERHLTKGHLNEAHSRIMRFRGTLTCALFGVLIVSNLTAPHVPQVLESGNLQVQMDEIDLEEQIGRGGFGAVYKGSWRGAQVAVKYIACDVADDEAVDQSVREVVLSKKMSHPNVVQTYGFTMTGSSSLGVDDQVSGSFGPIC